ncbi:MAG: hypothetical protein EP311_07245 [Cytophagales bacterium]|nr:MAG: hypothetical protein EP311_07245 [Cytophagales bacterium]
MKKALLSLLLLFSSFSLWAQESSSNGWYSVSSTETILSLGSVKATGLETNNVVRFTPFFNYAVTLHKDFSDKAGFYFGVDIRNVGIITDLNDSVRVKQRTYNLGIPIALKFGDMKGNLVGIGINNEFAINYKQKTYVNDEKSKTNIWFSDRTKIYLPSAFIEFKAKTGNYIRFKYYLTDYLIEENQAVNVAGVNYRPTQSNMMYLSVGFMLDNREILK